MKDLLTVAEVAARFGISASAVRYYQRLGLLTAHTDVRGDRRRFDEDVLDRLRFIRSAQRLGLSLAEIAELLSVRDGRPGASVEELLHRHLATLEGEIARLQELRQEISAMLARHAEPFTTAVGCGESR